jgi:hypothetical protein
MSLDVGAVDVHTFEMDLPVRVRVAEVEIFVEYVTKKLRSLVPKEAKALSDFRVIKLGSGGSDYVTSGIKESREESGEASLRTIEFEYRSTSYPNPIRANNKIILRKEKEGEVYTTKLLTKGQQNAIEKAASLVRKILMEWSAERGKVEE